MNKLPVFLFFLIFAVSCCDKSNKHSVNSYFFNSPATVWEETFPLGNGRIGIMPDGGIESENYVLNEISLWSGNPQDANNPEAKRHLPEIRRLLFAGRPDKAQELMYKTFVCGGRGSGYGNGVDIPYGSYQLLGNMIINYKYDNEQDSIANYRRTLDIETAVADVEFQRGKTHFNRRTFTSFVRDVAVIELNTDKSASLSFSINLNRPQRAAVSIDGNDLILSGQLNDGYNGNKGMKFGAKVRIALPKGGTISTEGDTALTVKGATQAVVFVAMATDYFGQAVETQLNEKLRDAEKLSFKTLLAEHTAAYRKLFERVKIDLGHNVEKEKLPVDERLAAFAADHDDPSLMALYYQFGRYLLISSTRVGSLPPNLQGLWTKDIHTAWNGDYHSNINVQMNHWIAEQGALPELHTPLIEWIKSLVPSGRKTAEDFYSSRGWVMHLLGNVWQFTAPGEHPSFGATNTAAAWLCAHLYQHYLYNRDKNYLAEIYPVMKESALFFTDMLVEDPRNHFLVTAPTTSPENGYRLPNGNAVSVSAGSTMDNQIIRELFSNTVKAAEILGIDQTFCDTLDRMRLRLMPTTIAPDGRIMEWLENFEELDLHHRHVSHLYGLHPANEISVEKTPELAAAARKTLEVRGDESTGWSMAWKVNFWARLHDGEHAWKLLCDLLRPCSDKNVKYSGGGGTYPNLFDAHPPFQIDGNFGGAAGIGEMLLQSQNGIIEILPALPSVWNTGSFEGLRVEGGAEASAKWTNGKLIKFQLKALTDNKFKIRLPDGSFQTKINGKATNLPQVEKNLEAELKKGDVVDFFSI